MAIEPKTPLPPTHPVPASPGPPKPVPAPQTRPQLQRPPVVRPAWPAPPPGPVSQPSPWGRLAYLGLGWLAAMIIAGAVALVVGGAVWFYRSDIIMPGVYADGLALGGLSQAEAASLLQQQWPEQQISLAAGSTTRTVAASALGLEWDAAATAHLAHEQGRSWASLRTLLDNRGGLHLAPVLRFEALPARQTLQDLAPHVEIAPVEADIRFVAGRVEAVPAAAGRTLDIPATLAELAENPGRVLAEGRLTLQTKLVEPTRTDVSQAVKAANALLATPLALQAYDPITDEKIAVEIDAAVWGPWLSFALTGDEPPRLEWKLDETQARAYVGQQIEQLGQARYLAVDDAVAAIGATLETQTPPPPLRIYHAERRHTVRYGETLSSIGYDYGLPYPWLEQANPDIEALRPGQVIVIPSPDALLPLPVVENKRLVVSLSEQTVRAYEAGQIKWEWPASTGIPSSPTAPGVFQVQSQEPNAYAASWNLWMPHFLGIYRPVPAADFMNGFHGFPTRNGSTLLWTDDLGHPVTYGCILISSENAQRLYDWAEPGLVVEIQK